MSEFDDPGDDVARLEHALERIAALARRGAAPAPSAGVEDRAAVDEVASRLDALIRRLRSVLSESE